MWLSWKRKDNIINKETFLNIIEDVKVRLDLVEDDIKRLRKKAKIPEIKEGGKDSDEDIIKSIEDDGFKEIRELNKKFGGTKSESGIF